MSKLDQLKALGEAKRLTRTDPVAKATKAKPFGLDAKGSSKIPVTPADRVASRLGAGRTAQDSPRLATAEAVAIRGRGRPKVQGKRPWELAGMTRRTWYRRQKESKSEKGG